MLGCRRAMMLDGGISSQLSLRYANGTVRHYRQRLGALSYFVSSTETKLPAGSLNHAIVGPPSSRWMPFASVFRSPSL